MEQMEIITFKENYLSYGANIIFFYENMDVVKVMAHRSPQNHLWYYFLKQLHGMIKSSGLVKRYKLCRLMVTAMHENLLSVSSDLPEGQIMSRLEV